MTIEAHFRIGGAPSGVEVVVGSINYGWIGITPSGALEMLNNGTDGSQPQITSAASVTDNQWHTATMVVSGSVMTGYLDGATIGTITSKVGMPGSGVQFGVAGFEDGNFALVGGAVDEVSIWSRALDAQAFAAPTDPYQGVESGLLALYHLDGAGTDASVTPVAASLTDASIYWSPWTWATPGDGSRRTINAGAYLKTTYSGTRCALALDTTANAAPMSQVSVSVDGMPARSYPVSGSIPCAPPAGVIGPRHSLRVSVKSTSEGLARWTANPQTQVAITGITIDAGQTFGAPVVYPRTMMIYGDSITEGVRTLGYTQPSDTDRNDNAVEWSAQVASRLNAEYGIVGFGGHGLTVSGSGGVPALPTSWSTLYPGQTRSFASCPDLLLENEGTNDGNADAGAVQTAERSFLTQIGGMCAGTRIVVMRPYAGYQWPALQAAVAAVGSRNIAMIDTTGYLDPANGVDDTGLHPSANNAVSYLAPAVLTALERIISANPAQNYTYH